MADYNPRLKKPLAGLTLAALGVVYGDIGTSPLYAAKETFNPDHGIPLNTANVLGGLSAIFWALMIVVTLKYVVLIMRANNKGEGGIMALLALASSAVKDHPRWVAPIMVLGVFGASLFYGDAVLTPAISVLSAVEGLEVGTAAFKPYVVPIAVGVVIGLFALQRQGTSLLGALFGPIAVLWCQAIAALGIRGIASAPEVLWAVNPAHALDFVTQHGYSSFVVLGAVVLAFTGAEALYADMGHFGKTPIRIAWFGLVFPALVLNYFGQGALLITSPKALDNPFYLLAPAWALYPMVALATAATVIASQATISGTYSLTKQAIQLDYLPRMNVTQTSARESGQIYIRGANWVLLVVIVAAVIGFGSSTRLRLRRGGDGDDAGYHDPHLFRRSIRVALQPVLEPCCYRLLHRHRCGILLVEPAQDPRRRLVPARARGDRVHGNDDMAPRQGNRDGCAEADRNLGRGVSQLAGRASRAAGDRDSNVHGRECG